MAYDDLKKLSGRTPVYLFEMELDRCPLTYGVPPCGANGADPGKKCFQTFNTCGAPLTFVRETQRYRFASQRLDASWHADGLPVFPTLTSSVNTAPTRLEPGRGLGIRSTLTVQIMDHPWTDVRTDPYRSERLYDPLRQGSFWGRLIARNRYYEGRWATLYIGYLDEDGLLKAENCVTRRYLLHRISGPDARGMVTVECKDPLKAADSEKAQWPPQLRATLKIGIDDAETTLDIDDPDAELFDYLDTYAAGRWVRIDDEIMQVSAYVNAADNTTLTVVRGPSGMPSHYEQATNIADDHNSGATVQPCYNFDIVRIDNIVNLLLATVSGIDPTYLDTAGWSSIIDTSGYDSYQFSALICEPTGVKELLQELTQHNISLWWDERAQLVRMGTLLQTSTVGVPYGEASSILSDSVSVTKDVKARVSQVWIGYGVRNPTYQADEFSTYRTWDVAADLDKETEFEYGQRKVRRIRSRWIPQTLGAIASEIISRALVDAKDTKTFISLTLDPKDDEQWTGDVISVASSQVQDEFGAPLEQNYLIIEVGEQVGGDGVRYDYVLQGQGTLKRTGVITPDLDPRDITTLEHDGEILLHDGVVLEHGALPPAPFPDYPDAGELTQTYAFIAYDQAPDPPGTSGVPGFNDGTSAYQIT